MAKQSNTKVRVDKSDSLHKQTDLFTGKTIETIPVLMDRYSWYPFNVFYTPHKKWNERRKKWRDFLLIGDEGFDTGIQASEIEEKTTFDNFKGGTGIAKTEIASEAVFDPFLLEVLADLFCPDNGSILDPFNGSHVSGCVFQKLGYEYTGIDIRPEIIEQNIKKVNLIIPENPPRYLLGDCIDVLDELVFEQFDMINSCPPYVDLVKYSKKNPIKGDMSLLSFKEFLVPYKLMIKKCAFVLKSGGYACFTVGDVRDKKTGELYEFLEETIRGFKEAGMMFYNRVTLVGPIGSACIRAKNCFERGDGKMVNVQQTILIFKKP